MASPAKFQEPSDPQYTLWVTRVRREYEQMRNLASNELPKGVHLKRLHLDCRKGKCVGEFDVFVPFREGSEALSIIPLTSLVVSTSFVSCQTTDGHRQQQHQTRDEENRGYPFHAPKVVIIQGVVCLPKELYTAQPRKSNPVPGERRFLLQLPILKHWTPARTIVQVLAEFVSQVQQHDPCPIAPVATPCQPDAPSTNPRKHGKPDSPATAGACSSKRLRLRKRDIHGALYPCRELNKQTEMEVSLMLIQKRSIILIHCPSKPYRDIDANDYLLVREVIPLQRIARITPRKAKSLTVFVKHTDGDASTRSQLLQTPMPCRTFYTKYTEEILNDVRQGINSSRGIADGAKPRGHDTKGAAENDGQFFPFITSEHTDKAKEISSRFLGKLGSYANSVSRFFTGEEEQVDQFESMFAEIDNLKREFFVRPSKVKMAEINGRYKQIVESAAGSSEKSAARALEELQVFIERPETQKILLETCAYEQAQKGIRVHG